MHSKKKKHTEKKTGEQKNSNTGDFLKERSEIHLIKNIKHSTRVCLPFSLIDAQGTQNEQKYPRESK